MQLTGKDFQAVAFRYVLMLSALALFISIAMYAWLGIFSRYIGDDYCEAMLVNKTSPLGAVVQRYTEVNWPRATMRYSNLLFVGFSEMLGSRDMPITIASMILLWAGGLVYLIRETRTFLRWNWAFPVDLLLGLLAAFFSFFLAPNLFQSIYWRSAMMTHFAPLVFGSYLFGFLANQMRRAENRPVSPLVHAGIFFAAFIIAGFSEPPTTTMLIALPLSMLAVWVWGNPSARKRQLALPAVLLAGVFLGLIVMLVSPASADAAQEKQTGLFDTLFNSFEYSYLFITDSLSALPLPLSISMLVPMLVFSLHPQEAPSIPVSNKAQTALIMLALPLLAWLLIAAGFAPSAYGQGFPVERMRFLARVTIIIVMMLEGSILGALLKQIPFSRRGDLFWFGLAALVALSAVYPLRAAYNVYQKNTPSYRERARLWDMREAMIHQSIEQGHTNLVVQQFDGVDGVKEMDVNDKHWVNRCAAKYYGVESIRAYPDVMFP